MSSNAKPNYAIDAKNLTVYYGKIPAISNVDLKVEDGEFLGIIGPNGGGKSTLLKAILGLVPISSGSVNIYRKPVSKNRNLISYVPQFAAMDKRFPITLKEVVLTGFLKKGLSPFYKYNSAQKEIANELIEKVGLSALSNRRISELSGGEFQKMIIARALATEPKVLLLDEPTASVDPSSREQIYTLLENLNKDVTIVLVTHDTLAISSHVRTLACLNKKLVYHAEPELTEDVIDGLYGCPVDLIAHGVPHRVLKEHGKGAPND
ncbi:MAG TPA: ABC transporter ATP-binding protein [Oscillospiraceae bacterium]|nr:ABC transporter ATP-binding protein [Oscillospiraceae bacterium]